ncbi:hypothetical protein Tco_0002680 [Tanacetum coccineum]
MSEPMPSIPTQSTFTYPNPNPSASPSFTQDDTSESFIPEPSQQMPTFTQPAFSATINLYSHNRCSLSTDSTYSDQPNGQTETLIMSFTQTSSREQSKEVGKDAESEIQLLILLSLLMSMLLYKGIIRDIWIQLRLVCGNEESKKMRNHATNSSYTEFSVTEEEGLHKGYDRFQKILSQLNQVHLNLMLELVIVIVLKAAAAPTHSAFIRTASSCSKSIYSDQQNIVSSVSQTSGRSDNVMECVLHSFVAEKRTIVKKRSMNNIDQIDSVEMEELDLKWQMCSASLRLNRFEKKAMDES